MRGRQRGAALAVAACVHLAILVTMLQTRTTAPVVTSLVWTQLMAPARPVERTPGPALATATTHRPVPIPSDARPLSAPVSANIAPARPIASALASTAPASAASAPPLAPSPALRLQLSREELRAFEAHPTLAQRLAAPPASSVLARSLTPAPEFSEDDNRGFHTVRSHGGCFILVPSGQSQVDPFNHGGERLVGRSTGDNC